MKRQYLPMVEQVLRKYPETRNSDRTLCQYVYVQLGVDVSRPWFIINANNDLPSIESLGRMRRKLQEMCPELRANAIVQENRTAEQAEYIAFSRM